VFLSLRNERLGRVQAFGGEKKKMEGVRNGNRGGGGLEIEVAGDLVYNRQRDIHFNVITFLPCF